MREIKFRAWDLDNEVMEYFDFNNITKTIQFLDTYRDYFSDYYFSTNNNELENAVLMQFTGLLDKNGKEIYENDKIKCSWLAELGIKELDCEAVGTVVYQTAIAAYVVEFDNRFVVGVADEMVYEEENMQLREFDEDETISFEIIGNIYES